MENTDSVLKVAAENVERISKSAQWWIVPLARFGFAAKGFVYIIIGLLAALAAFGGGGKKTDSRGAFEEILSKPFGKVLLAVVAVGLAGYAVWRFVQAIVDTENKGSEATGIAARSGFALIGVIYTILAFSAARMVFGGNGDNKTSEQVSKEWTATFLAQPLGQWLVGAAGLGFITVAVFHFYKAYNAKFRENLMTAQMDARTETFAIRVEQFGLAARGVVFGIIGGFLIQAAMRSDANQTRGLGGALQALEQQSYGQILLGVVAFGLIAYGLHMFVLALFRRIII